jgi:hypothetical protein
VRPDTPAPPSISELAQRRLSRRTVLAGGLATATASFFAANLPEAAATEAGAPARRPQLLGFPAIPPSVADQVVLPPGVPVPGALPMGPPDRATVSLA